MTNRFQRREKMAQAHVRRRVQRAIASQHLLTRASDEKTRALLKPFLERLEAIQERLDRAR